MSRLLARMPPLALRRVTQRKRIEMSQQGFNSSQPQPSASPKEIGFYQVFGRPIAKVLLMATFTYQLSYWLWVKLEKDEIMSQRTAEIEELETRLSGSAQKNKDP